MNRILDIPIELRLIALFILGALVGRLINVAVAWLLGAYASSELGASGLAVQKRTNPAAHIPVIGPFWRSGAGMHPARLAGVELLSGLLFVLLYWWGVHRLALMPAIASTARISDAVWISLHAQFVAQAILATAMLSASLVDLDEKIIPDAITIPGTLAGLLFAVLCPWSLLPDYVLVEPAGAVREIVPDYLLAGPAETVHEVVFMRASSPNAWPAPLAGYPRTGSLLIALGGYWLWCVALLPRRWRRRHGWRRALEILARRIAREPFSLVILLLGVVGAAGIASVWFGGGPRWEGLTSALIGMVAGGGIVWIVRIVGGSVLRREAMGFGDVTLLAMIGTFVGWQASLAVFFIAPIFALLLGLTQLVLRRDTEIPYGPFLCLASLAVILNWRALWDWLNPAFGIVWLVPAAVVICMVLMALLLGIWRWVREMLFGGGQG